MAHLNYTRKTCRRLYYGVKAVMIDDIIGMSLITFFAAEYIEEHRHEYEGWRIYALFYPIILDYDNNINNNNY